MIECLHLVLLYNTLIAELDDAHMQQRAQAHAEQIGGIYAHQSATVAPILLVWLFLCCLLFLHLLCRRRIVFIYYLLIHDNLLHGQLSLL